jgi:hypothetical protein
MTAIIVRDWVADERRPEPLLCDSKEELNSPRAFSCCTAFFPPLKESVGVVYFRGARQGAASRVGLRQSRQP